MAATARSLVDRSPPMAALAVLDLFVRRVEASKAHITFSMLGIAPAPGTSVPYVRSGPPVVPTTATAALAVMGLDGVAVE